VTFPSTDARSKPILDEGGFQQLLAAAYVLQQHNDSVRAKDPRLDSATILSQIAEIQSLVRAGEMDREATAVLITERLQKMTDAGGVSLALSENGFLECIAESGLRAEVPGGCVVANSLVPTERLRERKQFQSADAQKDVRLDIALCRELGVGSLLAVPIPRAEGTAGLLELRWSKADAFYECDIRTCQLMAGLVAELLECEDKKNAINGNSRRFRQTSSPKPNGQESLAPKDEVLPVGKRAEDLAAECRVCGRVFAPDEKFCGHCSMPRVAAAPADDLQSKWASMWFMQQAHDTREEKNLADMHPVFSGRVSESAGGTSQRESAFDPEWPDEDGVPPEKPGPLATTNKAVDHARNTAGTQGKQLEGSTSADSFANQKQILTVGNFRSLLEACVLHLRTKRRATLLMACGIALAFVLTLWSVGPARSSSQLTWFESLLVELGLAEVPAGAPSHLGSADVRVWVDVHTALYYCPGADLYGKTPGGRFISQRAAQQDQFEPATRVACE